jgi:hypothetical protein
MSNRKMAHKRRCRGPKLGVYIQRKEGVDWVQVALAMGDQRKVTPDRIHALRTSVMERFANRLDDRLGCGFDVTPLMEEVPWDGQQHYVDCPKCGQKCGVRHEALEPVTE